jgi:hydroxyethylthiazole kinase-like uncharacterized protein yjeF
MDEDARRRVGGDSGIGDGPRPVAPGTLEGFTAAQVRAAEAPHLEKGEPLMQRAADGLAAAIERLLARGAAGAGPGHRARVLILAGSGNNGGDALFAGERLARRGSEVTILPLGSRLHEAGLAAALDAGATAAEPRGEHEETTRFRERVAALASRSDVIVDGILGTGTSADPALRGAAAEAVSAIRESAASTPPPLVVAVDLPSGIGPDDGSVPDGNVLAADLTVTFGAIKAGLLRGPASRYAGRVELVDIGLLPDLSGVEPAVRVTR